MPDEFDPYKARIPFLKDDFDGTITFGRFQQGDFGLSYMPVIESTDGDVVEPRYGIGRGWMSPDGGASVRHESGREHTGFDDGTDYMDLIVFMMDAGAREVLYKRYDDGLGPRFADNYTNLTFHWEVIQRPKRRPKLDESGARVKDEQGRDVWEDQLVPKQLPTKFLGVAEEARQPQMVAAAGKDPLASLSVEDRARVEAVGKESPTYFDFIDALRALTDKDGRSMINVEDIRLALATEEWYADLHGR